LKKSNCLFAYADLCNHIDLSKKQGQSFGLRIENKNLKLYVEAEFKKGQEVDLQYINEPTNVHLLHHYGFFIKQNKLDYSLANFLLTKPRLNKDKNKILIKYNIVSFNNFIKTPLSVRNLEYKTKLYPNKLNNDLLKVLRIYYWDGPVLSDDELQIGKLEYNIKNNTRVSQDNELMALLGYKLNVIQNNIKNSELGFIDIIKSLEYTKSFVNDNKSNLNYAEMHKFEIRSKIVEVCKEDKLIKIQNSILVDEDIKGIISDQFVKLRDLYTNHEFIKQNLSKKQRNN
jgi:hypothetical protein